MSVFKQSLSLFSNISKTILVFLSCCAIQRRILIFYLCFEQLIRALGFSDPFASLPRRRAHRTTIIGGIFRRRIRYHFGVLSRSCKGRDDDETRLYYTCTNTWRHRHFSVRLSPPSAFIIVVVVCYYCCHIRDTYNGIMIVMNYDRHHNRYSYYSSGPLEFWSLNFRLYILISDGRRRHCSLPSHDIIIEMFQVYFIIRAIMNENHQRKYYGIIRFLNDKGGTNTVF